MCSKSIGWLWSDSVNFAIVHRLAFEVPAQWLCRDCVRVIETLDYFSSDYGHGITHCLSMRSGKQRSQCSCRAGLLVFALGLQMNTCVWLTSQEDKMLAGYSWQIVKTLRRILLCWQAAVNGSLTERWECVVPVASRKNSSGVYLWIYYGRDTPESTSVPGVYWVNLFKRSAPIEGLNCVLNYW
jgi:hypothetical protein